MAAIYSNLGNLRHQQRSYDEAEAFYRKAFAVYAALNGKKSPQAADIDLSIAALFQEAYDTPQKLDEAHKLAEAAVGVMETAYGKEHTQTARAYRIHGRIMVAEQKPEKAVPVLSKAVEIIKEMYGDHHAETAKVKADYGWTLLQAGDASEAAEILAAAEQVFGATIGMQHLGILTIQRNLAQAHLANENIAEAARSFINLARTVSSISSRTLRSLPCNRFFRT